VYATTAITTNRKGTIPRGNDNRHSHEPAERNGHFFCLAYLLAYRHGSGDGYDARLFRHAAARLSLAK
jgi:hypothetical protein